MLNITDRQGNANQNHSEVSQLSEWPFSKRTKEHRNVGKKASKFSWPKTLLVEMQIGAAAVEDSLPYDPAIPLLVDIWKKPHYLKDTCTPMFIAALFTIVEIWKQPKRPSTDEWIEKMWMEYSSAIKQKGTAICSNMDGHEGHYVKWNKSEKDKYCMISYVESKKYNKQWIKWKRQII